MKFFNLIVSLFLITLLLSCNSDKDVKTVKIQKKPVAIETNIEKESEIVKMEKEPIASTDMHEYVPPATALPEEIAKRLSDQEKNKNSNPIIKKEISDIKTVKETTNNTKDEIIKKEVQKVSKSTSSVKKTKKKVKKPSPKKTMEKYGKLKFDEETFQFGVLVEGDEISHTFKFRNIGNASIAIENVLVSCGCTTPEFPFTDIKPGQQNEITVYYSSKNKWGHQKPSLNVITNGDPAEYIVYLEGDVHERPSEEKVTTDSIK